VELSCSGSCHCYFPPELFQEFWHLFLVCLIQREEYPLIYLFVPEKHYHLSYISFPLISPLNVVVVVTTGEHQILQSQLMNLIFLAEEVLVYFLVQATDRLSLEQKL